MFIIIINIITNKLTIITPIYWTNIVLLWELTKYTHSQIL